MIRRMLAAALAIAALIAMTPGSASADPCTYYNLVSGNCAPAVPYPGPFDEPPEPIGAFGFGDPRTDETPDAVTVVEAVEVPSLAFTGSESTVFAYVGTGLIAFGAIALGSRRKVFQEVLD